MYNGVFTVMDVDDEQFTYELGMPAPTGVGGALYVPDAGTMTWARVEHDQSIILATAAMIQRV